MTEPEGSTFRPNPAPRKKKPRAETSRTAPLDSKARVVVGGPNLFERILFGRVSTGHLATFCRQFGAYLDAGVDLLRSIESLRVQFEKTALGPVLQRVGQAVRRGEGLAEAARREPQAFDSLFVAMLEVAEARGGIPETMKMMAGHYEARQRLIRQARSAMIYPIAVIGIAFGVGMLLTVKILPVLVSILEDMAQGRSFEMPLPTKILIEFNHFIARMGWWLLPTALVGTIVGLGWLYRRPVGKAAIDGIGIHVPVVGSLLRKMDTARFARTLSALLEAGVDLHSSLDLTAQVVRLEPFRKAVRRSKDAVMDGLELSDSLHGARLFSRDVIAIVESGEETGKLPETLDKLADEYEEQVEYMVKNLGSLIQPLIFLVIGGVVMFIALAFIMVYVSLLTNLL